MAARHLFTVVACLLLALNVKGLETVNGRIKVTIQTTAGCGDTVRFIVNDLAPTYDHYKDFLDIEFLPWGRAERQEDGSLTCQFGVNDCWANRLHRCALNMLKDNQDAQVHYMTCEYTKPSPSYDQGSYLCAHAVGLSLVDIDYCVANPGDKLDNVTEVAANILTEKIDFIPSIVLNDVIDKEQHEQAYQNFESLICSTLAADPTTNVDSCVV